MRSVGTSGKDPLKQSYCAAAKHKAHGYTSLNVQEAYTSAQRPQIRATRNAVARHQWRGKLVTEEKSKVRWRCVLH